MLKYIQVSHDFSDSQLFNKIVKLERKKLVVFPEKHNDVFWKTLRAFLIKYRLRPDYSYTNSISSKYNVLPSPPVKKSPYLLAEATIIIYLGLR